MLDMICKELTMKLKFAKMFCKIFSHETLKTTIKLYSRTMPCARLMHLKDYSLNLSIIASSNILHLNFWGYKANWLNNRFVYPRHEPNILSIAQVDINAGKLEPVYI